jgi:hypothetical protein
MTGPNDKKINDNLEVTAKNLHYPRNIVFDNNGSTMYFIDANEIKLIDNDGVIKTLISNEFFSEYRPKNCDHVFLLNSFKLYWPLSLAINPIDNSLYVLDEGVIYKITEKIVEVIVGQPFGCINNSMKLNNPIDMSFSSEGDLYVLENDSINGIKQIRLIKSDGSIEIFFGDNKQFKEDYSRVEYNENVIKFNDPIAIAVHQNRSVFVLDKGNFNYKSLKGFFLFINANCKDRWSTKAEQNKLMMPTPL